MKKFLGLLSITFCLFILIPSCKHKHGHGDGKCCKSECCVKHCCAGEKCDDCKMHATEKTCACKADCCKEKCCGGSSCDDCISSDGNNDSTSAAVNAGGAVANDPFLTAKYICPMKCEGGYSDKPGKCVACGMDLKERK